MLTLSKNKKKLFCLKPTKININIHLINNKSMLIIWRAMRPRYTAYWLFIGYVYDALLAARHWLRGFHGFSTHGAFTGKLFWHGRHWVRKWLTGLSWGIKAYWVDFGKKMEFFHFGILIKYFTCIDRLEPHIISLCGWRQQRNNIVDFESTLADNGK